MTGFLLDTNVLSETRKTRPDAGVMYFIIKADAIQLFLSVLTIGEFYKGIEKKRLTDSGTADQIAAWVHGIETGFSDRILIVDATVARVWGELSGMRSTPVIDTLIAATALVHGLTVVTRNTKDFVGTGVPLLNPWMSVVLPV